MPEGQRIPKNSTSKAPRKHTSRQESSQVPNPLADLHRRVGNRAFQTLISRQLDDLAENISAGPGSEWEQGDGEGEISEAQPGEVGSEWQQGDETQPVAGDTVELPGGDGGGGELPVLNSSRFAGIPVFARVMAGQEYLRYGCPDAGAVSAVQSFLSDSGIDCGGVDGAWGRLTDQGVREFQGQQNLEVDGIIGRNTLTAMDRADSGGSPPPPGQISAEGATAMSASSRVAELNSGEPLTANVFNGLVTDLWNLIGLDADKPPDERRGPPVVDDEYVNIFLQGLPVDTILDNVGHQIILVMTEDEQAKNGRRLTALLNFWKTTAPRPGEQPVSPVRNSIVSLALSQLGAVEADKRGELDPNDTIKHRHFRIGADRLKLYFDTALGEGNYTVDNVLYFEESRPAEWCGIFVFWVLKNLGLITGSWRWGDSISKFVQAAGWKYHGTEQDKKYLPRPGDVGVLPHANHQDIIEFVNTPTNYRTVDGNTSNADVGTGGTVNESNINRSSFFCFWSLPD